MNDDYLTTSEASKIFKFPEQTLYNLIHKGILIKGIHYFKPVPKKILFSKEAMKRWVESSGEEQEKKIPGSINSSTSSNPSKSNNYITI